MTDTAPDQCSEVEIRCAIEALTEKDLCRLRGVAGAWIYIGDLSWSIDDLLQEAVRRLLDGQRSWRSDMTLVPLLVGIMKSVASTERSSRRHQSEVREVDLPLTPSDERDESHLVSDGTDPSIGAEEVEYQAAVDALLESLNDDPLARDILLGNIYGYKRAELIDHLGLTPNEFDTGNRRLKRQIAQFAENMWETS